MIPGEVFPAEDEIILNAAAPEITLMVANTGDRPVQVGSHYHFAETNAGLAFDRAAARNDLEGIVVADQAFHDVILQASGNPFLESVMQPLQQILIGLRRKMGMDDSIRHRVRSHHFAIRRAIASGNDRAAEAAMRAHLEQARNDLVLALPDIRPSSR